MSQVTCSLLYITILKSGKKRERRKGQFFGVSILSILVFVKNLVCYKIFFGHRVSSDNEFQSAAISEIWSQ